MGGSLPLGVPAEFYVEAMEQAHAQDIPVIFDSSGPALTAGIRGRPDLIKPNLAEFSELLGYMPNSQEEVLQGARQLHDDFDTSVIVTLGEGGAIAVSREGSFFIDPVSVPVVSSAGAGDGVLAGMAMAYERRESFHYGLQHGFALAAAVLKTLPTADFRAEDYQGLLPRICMTSL
jgi:1-phosphofructokinase